MTYPLLALTGVSRCYASGEETVVALKNINLHIHAGEMVALCGPSGSGKSTLLNLLGCLDLPTAGSYRIDGQDTQAMSVDALAKLRCMSFGFIFQRYHLLPDLDAKGNVALPAIYAGISASERDMRVQNLLRRLGMADRSGHRSSQLSGGQQQRVSIARALMNGGQIILADEPTGALDKRSGQEVMRILGQLHQAGHTIILVTHDMQVASHAQRIIEIDGGEIVADRSMRDARNESACGNSLTLQRIASAGSLSTSRFWREVAEAIRMALQCVSAHRLRSFLTMLGIMIGIASVVSVAALGEGSRRKVLEDISALGTNTLVVYPGRGYGDRSAAALRSLNEGDVQALGTQWYAQGVTPEVSTSVTVKYRDISLNALLKGVGEQYFLVHGQRLLAGVGFSRDGVREQVQEVVIDDSARQRLFGELSDPVGRIVTLGNVPCRVVGVVQDKAHLQSESLNVWVPYTTALTRFIGQSPLQSITLRLRDAASPSQAQDDVMRLLRERHGTEDFFIHNNDDIRLAVESTAITMTLLGSLIALISLVVGGVGVMNMMLMSVSERTSEIGIRISVGARRIDIMRQFLIEAVVVCLLGGTLGFALAYGIGATFSVLDMPFPMHYSPEIVMAAGVCAAAVGLIFGYLPARNAARLNPIDALARAQ